MCKAFYYKKYDFDYQTGLLALSYVLIDALNHVHTFTEKIAFPNMPLSVTPSQKKILNHIFFLTHIAFGISYYKTVCPQKLVIESGVLTAGEAAFFNRFYLNGLGEFAVRNNLNLQGKIHFPFDKKLNHIFPDFNLKNRFLVPVGGGKDSCVSLAILKNIQQPCLAVSVGAPEPIKACAHISGLSHLILKRTIDSHLIELNQSGSVYNGHVPITGMLAFLLWACGVLYDYKYVALSCERSANSGNLMQENLEINHQYSKSFAFETDFARLTKTVIPNFHYFSLLRPLSEYHIARLFARLCADYFPVFTSCNKAFKLDETKRLTHWCGNCDKCRFVFLILAPYMKKETLIRVVGHNLLNDPAQLHGYEELLGLSGHKPFECVGEVDECRTALASLIKQADWQSDYIVQAFRSRLADFADENRIDNLLTPHQEHFIPQEILSDVLAQFKQ